MEKNNNTIQIFRYKTDTDNEKCLGGMCYFNCQRGILQKESLREGVSPSSWSSDSSDKTMKSLDCRIKAQRPSHFHWCQPLAGDPGFCEDGES